MNGREDRQQRLVDPKSGAWGTSSQDLVRLSYLLYKQSAAYAKEHDGNVSVFTLAGIPIIFSALRALLIEANAGMYSDLILKSDRLQVLSETVKDVNFVCRYYEMPSGLKLDLHLAYEVRNEILHPSHMPAGTQDGTPEYLQILRNKGLLQGGIWLSQLQSHKLFTWTCEVLENTALIILKEHYFDQDDFLDHVKSWSRYKNF